jgi:hypothetical protein
VVTHLFTATVDSRLEPAFSRLELSGTETGMK